MSDIQNKINRVLSDIITKIAKDNGENTILFSIEKREDEELNPHSVEGRLVEDFGLDSLHLVEFTVELEKEFLIDITDEECQSFKTLQDVITLVTTKTGVTQS